MTFINQSSDTKISTYRSCPHKYNLRYNYKIREEPSNKDSLEFGKYIHRIFELGDECFDLSGLRKIAEDISGDYPFSKSYDKKIPKCLNNFLKFNASLAKTIARELRFSIDIDDKTSHVGVIDRVIQSLNGDILIIDYKTSRNEKTKFELFNDDQLVGYTLAISKLYNIPVNRITAAHYYPITGNFVPVKYTEANISDFLRRLKRDVWAIRRKKQSDFSTRRNQFCNWCEYKEKLCPEFDDPKVVISRIDEASGRRKSQSD